MNYAESKTPFAFSVILYLSIRLKRKTGKSAKGMKRGWITIYLNLAIIKRQLENIILAVLIMKITFKSVIYLNRDSYNSERTVKKDSRYK
jgi:hypothetical protein